MRAPHHDRAGHLARRRDRRRRAAADRIDRRSASTSRCATRCRGRSAARMNWPAMHSRSRAPGASQPRCSAARTSASTRSTCGCGGRCGPLLDLLSLGGARVLLRPRHVARLGRGAAVLGVAVALAVRARDAARHPARRCGLRASRSSSLLRFCCWCGPCCAVFGRDLDTAVRDRSARSRPWPKPRKKSPRSRRPSRKSASHDRCRLAHHPARASSAARSRSRPAWASPA